MILNLSYTLKNKILLAGVIVFAFLSWVLAFHQTIDAAVLHRQLAREKADKYTLASNPEFITRRANELSTVFSSLEVDSAEWSNDFWLKASRIASQKGIEVVYRSSDPRLSEGPGLILKETIEFRGHYKELVLLLDSLENLQHMGAISYMKMFKPERSDVNDDAGKISLQVQFCAINKKNEEGF